MNSIQASLVLLIFCATLTLGEEEIVLTRLKGPPIGITEVFFKIDKLGDELGEVKIEGEVMQKMLLQIEEGKSHANLGVFYENATSKAVSPKYTIRFYNPYGILMGGIRVPVDKNIPEALVEPGGEGVKALQPRITKLDSLFRHADMKAYPSDFFSVSWLSISDTNTIEVERTGDKQPVITPESEPEANPELEPASK